MRCLYCGKELALLKRWTRGGQFCSEAHKKSYQEEYNRIGLSRLLQAQSKPKAAQQETDSGPKAPARPGSTAPVAVEEAPLEPIEETQKIEQVPEEVVAEVRDQTPAEVRDETLEDKTADEPSEAAWEPDNMAGFLSESTAEPIPIEVAPYSHPWQAEEREPIAPSWDSTGIVNRHLPEAAVLELKFRPNLAESEHSAPEVKVTPNEFAPGKPFPPALEPILNSNQLPSAGLLKLKVSPSTTEWSPLEPAVAILNFPPEGVDQQWSLLELPCTDITFSAEDAEPLISGTSADGALWESSGEQDAEALAVTDDAGIEPVADFGEQEAAPEVEGLEQSNEPVTAFDELTHLNQELTESHELSAGSDQFEEIAQEPGSEIPSEAMVEPSLEDVTPEEEDGTAPRSAEETVEIPLKIFAPLKPSPVEGAGSLIKLPVFLPGLTGLPFRPKMGLVAPTSGSPSKKSSQKSAPAPAQSKTAEETRPAESQKLAEPQKPAPEVQVKDRTAPPSHPAGNAKPWGKPTTPPAAKDPAAPARAAKISTPVKAQPVPSVKITPPAPAKPREENKPSTPAPAEKPTEAAAPSKPKHTPPVQTESQPKEVEAPSFGAAQLENTSWLGSLKGKLTIGGVAVLLCLGAYFIFGGKSQAPAPAANAAAVADKAGPSIMVGSGGWVEGWAGNPTGEYLGRQITIYRPSLKLSDYRIEFTGEIEHKSIGWVFRATDPDNYYVMKLAYTTPGLDPKIGLLKSVVMHGHETQIGKVPIDMKVRLETMYSIRVDVRGSKFTTYVQGQQVDTWTDDQLKVGGVGFLNEREERGRVKSVSVSLLNGGKQ